MAQIGDRQIRVGLAGVGWMGTTLLRRLLEHPGADVAAVYDRDSARARDTLREHASAAAVAGRFEELLHDSSMDAVFLCGPNSTHGAQSMAALEAGKHLFCEKPPSITFSDHLRQVELARANPRLVTYVDYILYFDSFEQRLRRMVADGSFGTVTQIQVNYRHAINIAGDKEWKLRRSTMGDAIGMGINHGVSVMLFAMQPQAHPVRVYATSMPAQVRRFEAPPIWNIQITFDNGACGFLPGDIDSGFGYDAYHSIHGSMGALVFDSIADRPSKVRYWSAEGSGGRWIYPLDAKRCRAEGVEPWPADTTTPDSGNVIDHQTGEAVGHFLDCVRSGTSSPLGVDRSAIVAEVGWAAQVSAVTGEPVDLPLDAAAVRRVISHYPESFVSESASG